jgi:hypothetical protein
MEQEQRTTAQELRQVAEYVENTSLDALASYSDISFPLVHGDPKTSPQPSAESRAAERGFDVLREDTEAVVTALYALAAALDSDLDVPQTLWVPVLPYLNAFRADTTLTAEESASESSPA